MLQSKLKLKTKNSMKNETIKLYNIKYFSKQKNQKNKKNTVLPRLPGPCL